MIDAILASALTLSVPLVFAALGGAIHRQAGVVNIGLEAHMITGAFIGALLSGWTGSWIVGTIAGVVAGAITGGIMSLLITRLHGNEIIVGLGFNIVTFGVIGYLLRSVFGVSGTLQPEGLERLPSLVIPGVADVPVLGAIVSGKDPLFWLAILAVPVLVWLFAHTRWGLRLRATGASEPASASLGLRTAGIRDGAGIIAGALAALGGVALSLGTVGLFNENMTAGRGYVALAAFYFGRSRPLPTALACLLFGFFDALQIRIQTSGGFSADIVSTLPYVAVVVVLAITGIRQYARSSRKIA
ncbi:ABC transporter permease [Humibacter sp. BT305]|uniref:ABC transporter permease n=1 Tax=Cnuibacter physcomitrellae TaxID=1619308 RepID=A0A1X9LH05_9MICO|nr:ABC transporter permease [Cnuibacter physcomitrellae]ARJ04433.1 ABC transporter permease [Cnuibacter physcomitrellae]AXH36915.1 ABC transporter permease [Humibacter sp. BT305]MCS5498489.1 ABC transporter permease [Cnuibacter physcomitrellae]GGI41044.1 ABC transporter permease [Cnuibacter physcomitrellae]